MTTTYEPELKLSAIKVHPRNPGHDVGDVTELGDSIRAAGVLEPVIVAPIDGASDTARHRWLLIAGHRRVKASAAAGRKTIPGLVRGDLDTEVKQLEAMVIENHHRRDLTPLEEGDAFQLLLDLGDYTQAKVAAATGVSAKTVRSRLKLTKLPQQVRDKFTAGQVTLDDALAIAEFADDPAAIKKLEREAGGFNFQWTLRRLRDERAAANKRAAAIGRLRKAGVTVLEQAPPADSSVVYVEELAEYPEAKDPDDVASLVELHASCPGHAALLLPKASEPAWICTQVDLHAGGVRKDDEGAQEGASSPAQLERQQLESDLETAAAVRRGHLRQAIMTGDPGLAASVLRRRLFSRNHRFLAECLDVEPKAIEGTLSTLSLEQLVIAVDVASHESHDSFLADPYPYGWRRSEWVTALEQDYGYQWSDVERRMIAEANPVQDGEPSKVDDGETEGVEVEDLGGEDKWEAAAAPPPQDPTSPGYVDGRKVEDVPVGAGAL